MQDLHIKYRPKHLDEIIGHTVEVKSLSKLNKTGLPHVFLFSGASGVGKTTLARIVGSLVHAEIIELDAATYSGVNDMRQLTEGLHYRSLKKTGAKCVIIDECHALSKSSWQSLLKIIEEPPPHVYFCFCTTEFGKVPKTIKTRAHSYDLKPLTIDQINRLLESVCKEEQIELGEDELRFIARKADGSARQALVYLSMSAGAADLGDIKKLVSDAEQGDQQLELFRLLVSGKANWANIIRIMDSLEIGSYESLRIGLVNYTAGAVVRSKKSIPYGNVAILDAFIKPFNRSTEKAEFLLALANLFGE